MGAARVGVVVEAKTVDIRELAGAVGAGLAEFGRGRVGGGTGRRGISSCIKEIHDKLRSNIFFLFPLFFLLFFFLHARILVFPEGAEVGSK